MAAPAGPRRGHPAGGRLIPPGLVDLPHEVAMPEEQLAEAERHVNVISWYVSGPLHPAGFEYTATFAEPAGEVGPHAVYGDWMGAQDMDVIRRPSRIQRRFETRPR
jgi:hypothetical protein